MKERTKRRLHMISIKTSLLEKCGCFLIFSKAKSVVSSSLFTWKHSISDSILILRTVCWVQGKNLPQNNSLPDLYSALYLCLFSSPILGRMLQVFQQYRRTCKLLALKECPVYLGTPDTHTRELSVPLDHRSAVCSWLLAGLKP